MSRRHPAPKMQRMSVDVPLSCFEHLLRLGSGAHAVVHKARARSYAHLPRAVRGRVVAVKMSRSSRGCTASKAIRKEEHLLGLLRNAPHENIVCQLARGRHPSHYTRLSHRPPSEDEQRFLVDPDTSDESDSEEEEGGEAKKRRYPQAVEAALCVRSFQVLEYLPMDLFHEIHTLKKRLTPDRVAWVAFCVGRAILHLHFLGWSHRDIKPENILVDRAPRGQVKVCDMGFAERCASPLEQGGGRAGTHDYSSPEAAAGKHNYWSLDAWQLGVVMLEMMAGKYPWGRSKRDRWGRDVPKEAEEGWPHELVAVARGLAHPDPGARWSVASAVAALAALLASSSPPSTTATT